MVIKATGKGGEQCEIAKNGQGEGCRDGEGSFAEELRVPLKTNFTTLRIRVPNEYE